MPRFHFSVYDGASSLDPEGMRLPDQAAARLEAVRRAGRILKADAQRVLSGDEWRMEVSDDSGVILFRLDFFVTASVAGQRGLQTSGRTDQHA